MDELKELLASIHCELAKDLLRRIKTGEASAQDLNVARQFLRDNGIDSTPKGNKAMQDLSDELPDNQAKALPFPAFPRAAANG